MIKEQVNIGILQSAGIAGRIIETALNNPEITDVFTPVIYSKENQNDKNVGADLKFGNIAAVVVAPGSTTEFSFPGAMIVYADQGRRIAGISSEQLAADGGAEAVRLAWQVIRRDFMVSMPRLAIVVNDEDSAAKCQQTVKELTEQGVYVFGPYKADEYIEENHAQHFDMTLAAGETVLQNMLDELTSPSRSRYIAGMPMIMTQTDYPANNEFDESALNEPADALRQAVYLAIDISANRKAYDEAHENPLPKLYHERRDDSEKVRFAIPKKKAEEQAAS